MATALPDVLASSVVFLVALPLCIGIAVACGVSVERGLVTGIIGGTVVGLISGAPLLVSGPAASLIVPVVDLIRVHGLAALAPVVVLAGAWQALAGALRWGQWFRAVAPAVIQGMLIGIGVLILTSQLHVCLDAQPQGSFGADVLALPASVWRTATGGIAPLVLSLATVAIIVGWDRLRPRRLALVPGQLVALTFVTVTAAWWGADVRFLEISPRFLDGLASPSLADFRILLDVRIVGLSLVFAFVASAATLLTATAIDQRQNFSKANYDRELLAQGVGNILTGGVGGLPMTGVIVRSSVNVDAGARTRGSTILHGVWILSFVCAAPQLLQLIPRASLGAILVYTGYRLIDVGALTALYRQGRAELAICLITLFGVVFVDLFAGVLVGLAAAVGKIVYTFARLEIRSTAGPSRDVQDLHLTGSATFLQLPRLAGALESIPDDRELHIHIDRLDHIDHACLQLLSNWNERRQTEGRPGMVVEWDELTERYRNAVVGAARDTGPTRSVTSVIWAELKQLYASREGGFIHDSRIRLQVDAHSLDEVVLVAADLLAPVSGLSKRRLADTLRRRVEGHVVLGGGISVPHAPIRGLRESIVALVTTRSAVPVDGEEADVFFVLLAPQSDPRQHLRSLAHVARLCHDRRFLQRLRAARTPEQVVHALRAANSTGRAGVSERVSPRLLALIETDVGDRAARVRRLVDEAFGLSVADVGGGPELLDVLRKVVGSTAAHLVVVPLEERDLGVLRVLLEEEGRLVGRARCRVHVLGSNPLDVEPEVAMAPRVDVV